MKPERRTQTEQDAPSAPKQRREDGRKDLLGEISNRVWLGIALALGIAVAVVAYEYTVPEQWKGWLNFREFVIAVALILGGMTFACVKLFRKRKSRDGSAGCEL